MGQLHKLEAAASAPEVTSELRCYMRHVRAAGICSRGSRAWCMANGVSWTKFLAEGIPAQTLLDTGDPIVLRVVQAAQQEQANV